MGSPRTSGEFVSDSRGIVLRAMVAAGISAPDELLVAAMAQAGVSELPHDAERVWELCLDVLLPLVRARSGDLAADCLRAKLEGALMALDAIQHNRGPAFTRSRG